MHFSTTQGTFLKRKRARGLWLAVILILSSFIGLGWNASAQPDNVWVEGYIKEMGSGIPIENATIVLQNTNDGTVNSTNSDISGFFNLSIYSPPGGQMFSISVFHEDYLLNTTYTWLVPGNPQNQTIFLDPATQKGSYVNGQVIDAVTMTPMPFTGVGAVGTTYINTTGTDATGYYYMTLESYQDYLVQVAVNGYETGREIAYFDWGDNKTIDFYMEPMNCTLRGYVNDSIGPLGSASVLVYRIDDVADIEYQPQVNSSTGYFELNLTRGVWQVEVTDSNYFTQTLTVLMVNGKITWQNFTMNSLPVASATVKGYVQYYGNGTGVPNSGIIAQNMNSTWSFYNSSNDTGWYTLSVIPGDIRISAWMWDPFYASEQIILPVNAGETIDLNITIIDPNENGYLEGYVRLNGTGEPDVQVFAYFGWWQFEAYTNATGYYNISVPAAQLNVQAIKEDFKTVFTQVNTTFGSTTILDLDIEMLDWSTETRGFINDSIGSPVSGAFVSFDYDGYGRWSSTISTDYSGFYQQMVPSGEASYYVTGNYHEAVTGNIDLPPDQLFWFNKTLVPVTYSANIIGRLTNIKTGKPIKYMELNIGEMDMQWSQNIETDSNGMFQAEVPSGFVLVSMDFQRNGFEEAGTYQSGDTLQFRIGAGETRWLNISLYPSEAKAKFSGFVNDTLSSPIPGATVYVIYGNMIITNVTDSGGYYEFSLPENLWVELRVRAPGYMIQGANMAIPQGPNITYDWVLDPAGAWIGGPITDSAADLDGDSYWDELYVNVTVNVATPGDYRLSAYLSDKRRSNQAIASTETDFSSSGGLQVITLTFTGELIYNSEQNGYFVSIDLYDTSTWDFLDMEEYYTAPYTYDQFDSPDAKFETPVETWLVDSDLDGLYNYLIINVTINVSVAGNYTVMAPFRDIWGTEFGMAFESYYLETGLQEVQISLDGASIYNNGETLGSCYLVLFEGFPTGGSGYIHTLFFYTPFRHDIFQYYPIDAFISGTVTDMGNQPIEGLTVWIYNITSKYLDETTTNASGYYELGGWSGDWIVVVNDDEDDHIYQGDLVEISLALGMNTRNFFNLKYCLLDEVEVRLIFSDWNNTYVDWLIYVFGDNKTIRFEMDVLQFGDGDGFLSESEVETIMGMLGQLALPDNSNESFLVDDIWYNLNQSSLTRDAGLVGSITSTDPVYIHMTGDYTANTTIPDPSPHNLTMNCSYDDTDSGNFIGNNVTHILYTVPPAGWGRTGNGTPQNVTISGADYITADSLRDPNPGDAQSWEWVNVTVSLGISPTVGIIRGNITLQGSLDHSGVVITVYDNVTQQEIASAPTNPGGYYKISGIAPGNYSIVAHKAGYADNRSDNFSLSAGQVLWFDFSLFSYPPTILHTPASTAVMGNAIAIVADVTDDGQVDKVVIYYKDVGSGSYTTTTMTRIPSTTTFMGSIPAQVQVGNVYYYIWANDTKGNFVTNPALGNHTIFIYELDPPEIMNMSVTPDPAEYPEFVNVSVEVDDFTNVEIVKLFIERPDLSTTNLTMNYDASSGRYYINASYSLLGTYNFTVWANDTFDNLNSSSGSFQVLDTLPPTSYVEWIAQNWFSTGPATINASASDSGIGIAWVELWYRNSTDNVSWSSWKYFGTDNLAPYRFFFNFPEGSGYYEFYSIAYDQAGNPETAKISYEALCAYDGMAPSTYVEVLSTYWFNMQPIAISAQASDNLIGVENVELWYRNSTDNSSWSIWKLFGIDDTAPYQWSFNFPEGEGYYEFFSLGNDSLGNLETMKSLAETICGYDTSSPVSNVDVITSYWHSTSPISINSAVSDTISGVENVKLWYRHSTDNSTWGSWTLFANDGTAPYQWSFDFPDDDGYYQFFSIATDYAQNTETMKVAFETICGYDIIAPSSNVQVIDPYLQSSSPLTIIVQATDDTSGVEGVQLWYRYSQDNSSWNPWGPFGSDDTSIPYQWNFDFSDGDGYYEFYSLASDTLGFFETAQSSADALCIFDSTPPVISSFSAVPDPLELGQTVNISAVISDVSGIDGAWIELTLGGSLIGNFSASNSDSDYWYSYSPNDIGTLDIIIWTMDNNGFWNSYSDSVLVQDTTSPSISNLVITPSSPEVGDNVGIRVDVDDASGITTCRINITDPNGNWLLNQSMTQSGGPNRYYYDRDYDLFGDYQFVIWAEDGNGRGSVFSDTVTIQDSIPPIADAGQSQRVAVGVQVTLDAGLSSDNDDISNYTWSFMDGGLKRLYGETVYYTFNTVDVYTITLMVEDIAGNTDTATTTVNVTAVSGTGTVSGTVRDKNGNPVSGATVYVDSYPDIDTTTDSLGRFTLNNVPTGNQTIIIEKDGFKWFSQYAIVQQDQTTPMGTIELAKSAKDDGVPITLYLALAAIIAVVIALLFFFLMKKKKIEGAKNTLIDEVFFMYNDGRLIKHFTRRLKPDMDEDILGSMLVAVQDFIKDSFRDQDGILDELKFGRFQVLLGRGKYIILATIVLGDEIEPFRPQVQKCVDDIEEHYGEALEDWDGEMSKVRGAAKYIMDLIDGRYA